MVAFNQMGEDASAHALPAVARRALELRRLVVKDGNALWVGDARGDIHPDWLPSVGDPARDETLAAVRLGSAHGAGAYYRGQRILSCCVLAVQGELLPPPAAAETCTYETRLAFPELRGQRGELSAFRAFVADDSAVHQWITLESQSLHRAPVRLTLTLACDGMLSADGAATGASDRSHLQGATLHLVARDASGTLQRTTITFDRAPLHVHWLGAYDVAGVPARVAVTFHLYPALAEPAVLGFRVGPAAIEEDGPRVEGFAVRSIAPDQWTASAAVRDRHARALLGGARYTAHQPALDAALRRAASDLRLLATPAVTGDMLPVSGLPDGRVVDTRDALIAGFQSLALDPRYASAVLRGLAPRVLEPFAGAPDQPWQRAQIAPLWVALLAETLDWSGDLALFDELLPAARRAVREMERRADAHGYLHAAGSGDSDEIRLEPQVYACLARRALARALRRRGALRNHAEIAALELGAETLRQHIERDFWLGADGCYASALDAGWRPRHLVTSASAHALWSRVATGPRAARLAARLTTPDLATGWGLRTCSAAQSGYDALSPLRGAIWTHETAFAAIGLLRNGHPSAGLWLARGVFAVAGAQLDARLPARVGGQDQRGSYEAAPYWPPEAGMPSALAVASPIALAAAMLGCEPDALSQRLTLRPVLPAWLRQLSVRHLRVGAARIDLDVTRVAGDGACDVSARVTAGECAVLVQPHVRAYA